MNTRVARTMKWISLVIMISLLAGALVLPQAGVSAAGLAQDPQPANPDAPNPERLEKLYQRQLRLLEGQAERLERTDEVVARAEERIAALKADGKDTSVLEEALANFQDQVEEARRLNEDAAEVLSAHAGFDANGKVTDAAAARETVKAAGQSLREAARTLRPAFRDLLKALREFRRDNR